MAIASWLMICGIKGNGFPRTGSPGWPALQAIQAQVGYKRSPGRYGGKPAVVASNTLDRQFEVEAPDKVWVKD